MNSKELIEKLENKRPREWDDLPDFMLYKDQVISYMDNQHIALNDTEILTPAMVNNFIKNGLMQRSVGKKYSREHIASLTMICLLKQELQSDEVGTIMGEFCGNDIERAYSEYLKILDKEFSSVASAVNLDNCSAREDKLKMALELAVSAYAQKLLCQKLIDEMAENKTEEKIKNTVSE